MLKSLMTTAAVIGLLGGAAAGTSANAQTAGYDGTAANPPTRHMRHRMPMRHGADVANDGMAEDGSAPPTSAYRGGASVPLSQRASNIGTQTGRSEVAPRLPDPNASSNTPEAFLRAAQRSLNQGKTGAAQQALEMAETRVLSRTTDPAQANTPDAAAMPQRIAEARRALGAGDRGAAEAAITAALAAPIPAPGPAVTTTYSTRPQ